VDEDEPKFDESDDDSDSEVRNVFLGPILRT
jgi:hypothetical protein